MFFFSISSFSSPFRLVASQMMPSGRARNEASVFDSSHGFSGLLWKYSMVSSCLLKYPNPPWFMFTHTVPPTSDTLAICWSYSGTTTVCWYSFSRFVVRSSLEMPCLSVANQMEALESLKMVFIGIFTSASSLGSSPYEHSMIFPDCVPA